MANKYALRAVELLLMEQNQRRERVLCADDEVAVSGWLADALMRHGFEVETAVDGHHAFYKLATDERGYDLLITDARMPHMDGWGLILSARSGGFRGGVIVFSGSLDDTQRERYCALPVDAFLPKPASAETLLQVVKEVSWQHSRTDI